MYKNILLTMAVFLLSLLLFYQVKTQKDITSQIINRPDLIDFVDDLVESGIIQPSFDKNDPLLKLRKIYITNYINESNAKDIIARLIYLDSINKKPIDIYISTSGGWGYPSIAIIETMKMIESPVNTWALGICYSSGALILASGTGKRYATENAIIMVHCNVDSSSEDYTHEKNYKELYEGYWEKKTELPSHWYPMIYDKAYYLNTEQALKYKVIDEVKKY